MTTIRVPQALVDGLGSADSVWTTDADRWFLNQLAPGVGSVEIEPSDDPDDFTPTGWLVYSSPDITANDVAIITVLAAAFAWVNEDPAERDARLAAMVAKSYDDRARFDALKSLVDTGELTKDEARALVMAEMLSQAETFEILEQVEAILAPPDDEELIE